MSGEKDIYEKVRGHFLLARLNVKGIFRRSVVWIYEFSEAAGASGFILNRPLEKTLASCAPFFSGTPLGNVPVFEGGPVGTRQLCFVMRSREALNGNHSVRVGVSKEELLDAVHKPGVNAYGFAGRAEWARGQLENELECGVWLRSRMDSAAWDAGGGEEFWRRLVQKSRRPESALMLRAPDDIADN